jgi:RNA-directed DNA polymerase
MHEHGKSDSPVVPANAPNKAPAAEVGEERGLVKGTRPAKRAPDTEPGTARPVRWIVCGK